jgi:hypothetical protein
LIKSNLLLAVRQSNGTVNNRLNLFNRLEIRPYKNEGGKVLETTNPYLFQINVREGCSKEI